MILNFLNELFGDEKPPKPVPKPLQKRQNTEGGVSDKKTGQKPKATIETTTWIVSDQSIPVEIYRERRNSWRFAFAKGGKLIVRLPKVDKALETQYVVDMQQKLAARLVKKPQLSQFFETKIYQHGDTLTVNTRQYAILLNTEDRKTHTGKQVSKGLLEFRLAATDTEGGQQKAISTLLSRIIAQDFASEFTRRVNELNFQHFKKPIKSIHFKYNHSNWGSCSQTGNLNFSSRLLFAPDAVQDYVIIHELAHLVELNHSDRFWRLVAEAMPDYKEKEKWLKKNSPYCRF